jgi:cell wall-associated NlpC family hydrolase
LKRLYKLLLLPLSIATATTVTSQASTKSVKHTIKHGETLYSIAHKNHTTIEKVRKINGIKKGDKLKIGKVLKVPKNTYKPKKKIVKTSKRTHKKIKMAKTKSNRSERCLAKTLSTVEFSTMGKSGSRKSNKFSLNDIVFNSSKGKGKSSNIARLAKKKLGRRYVWGAIGQKNTFDCSGLTSYVCKKNGISIPRRAIAQSKYGKYVSRSDLKPGDLIFFDTSKRRRGYVNHVGIYLGNNKFIHASSAKHKVVITSLNKKFYSQRFKGARRVASL